MQVFHFLFSILSANAWTILDPVYDQFANLIMSQVTGLFEKVQGELHAEGQATPVFDEFITKFEAINNAEVVRVLKSIDIELLLEDGLTPEDLVQIFDAEIQDPASDFYGMDLTRIGEEFTATLEQSAIEPFNNALLALTESAAVFQDVYNGDINLHSIVGSYADIMDAAITLNDIYNFTDSDALTQGLFYTSIVAEKALFVWEEWKEYLFMYQDVVDLTMNEYNRRIVITDERFCNEKEGFIKVVQEKIKFIPNVVTKNWATPIKKSVGIFNALVQNVPAIENYAIPGSHSRMSS